MRRAGDRIIDTSAILLAADHAACHVGRLAAARRALNIWKWTRHLVIVNGNERFHPSADVR